MLQCSFPEGEKEVDIVPNEQEDDGKRSGWWLPRRMNVTAESIDYNASEIYKLLLQTIVIIH